MPPRRGQPVPKPEIPIPDFLDPNALRASASVGDVGTIRAVLSTAAAPVLRKLVVALLASERRYDWVGAEESTPPACRSVVP